MLKGRRSIVGLDLGSTAIKAVELTRDGHGLMVSAWGQAEVTEDGDKAVALAELFNSGTFHTRRVATAVSGDSVACRFVDMAPMSRTDLVDAARFEASRQIPFDIDDVEMDIDPVSEEIDSGVVQTLLVAARRDVVAQHLRLLLSVGLKPVSVGVDGFALSNAWELNGFGGAQRGALALVDVGASKASISILLDGAIRFSREIPLTDQPLEDVVLDKLGNELRLSMDFFENQCEAEIGRVCLSGGAVLSKSVEGGLRQRLEVDVGIWNPLEAVAVDEGNAGIDGLFESSPKMAVAIGLAAMV